MRTHGLCNVKRKEAVEGRAVAPDGMETALTSGCSNMAAIYGGAGMRRRQTPADRRSQPLRPAPPGAGRVAMFTATMVRTPWGNADQLRGRMLPPGPGRPREEVARNQRERLFGAMVACVAEKGYEATTVADLLELLRRQPQRLLRALPRQGGLLPRRLRRGRGDVDGAARGGAARGRPARPRLA